MKKSLIALPVLIASSLTYAAEFQGPDTDFVNNAAHHAITINNWDQGENAASTFPQAYKFTHSYKLDTNGMLPEVFDNSKRLDLDAIMVSDIEGEMSLSSFLRDRVKNHSMVVLRDNQLLHEHYWNNMNQDTPHLDMSVTKSFISMAAQIAVAEGKLDMSKKVTDYLPEFKGTAWETATIQQVSDMRTSVIMDVPAHQSWDNRMTTSQSYNRDGSKDYPNGISDYFPLVTEYNAPMGEAYDYQCVNTEVLGKIVEHVTHKNLATNLEQIFQRVGVSNDVYLMADHAGGAMASGGLNATTKDLARIGRMLLNDGKNYLEQQVIPTAFIDSLLQGNDTVRQAWSKGKEAQLADGWYKDQFRVLNINQHKILAMIGIHGQILAMDKATGVVIAMNGGYPMSETPRMAISLFYKVIPAIIEAAERKKQTQPIGAYIDQDTGDLIIVGESE